MDVKLPDGTIIQNVPDGISRADLTAKLASNGYDVSKLAPAPNPQLAGVPGYDVRGLPQVAPAKTERPLNGVDVAMGGRGMAGDAFDKVFGAVEAPVSMISGMVAAPIGALAGAGRSLVGGKFGTQAGVKQGEDFGGKVAEALTYQPRTQTGQDITGTVGEALQDSGIAGLPIGPEAAALAHLAAPAARTAAASAKSAIAPGVATAQNAARKVASISVLPKIDPNTAKLADKAGKFGLTLTPDMLSDNKIVRIAGEASAKVPLSGAPNDANQLAFNRSLIKMIGGDETARALTPDVYSSALRTAGETIGDVAGKTPIPLDEGFGSALASHLDDAAKFQTQDVANVVNSYVGELQAKAAANGGVIDGTAFRTLNSKLGKQIRNTTNGDLKHALGQLQETMQDALQRHITSPEDLATLLDARRKYAIAKTIEPLVAKSTTGDISPAGLMGRVTANGSGKTMMATGRAGELGDLARVGQRFLKEPNSSNTAERSLAYGLMGGGAIANLPTTAGVFTAANLYNRLSPAIARKMVQRSLPRPISELPKKQ
jgi:hypothetical protein